MAHILIEFMAHGANHWETLGRFHASKAEIEALRTALENQEHPYEALEDLPKGLLFDALDICREEGHDARISFREEDA